MIVFGRFTNVAIAAKVHNNGIEKFLKSCSIMAVSFKTFLKICLLENFCELYICHAVSGWRICELTVNDSIDLSVNVVWESVDVIGVLWHSHTTR